MNISITKTDSSRISSVDFSNLPFGKIFSDHMFVVDFIDNAWQTPKIIPFGKMEFSPSMSAIHHGQSIFEGLKAYKNNNDEIVLFRPLDNYNRLNKSAQRMCMPEVPEDLFMSGLKQLINLDKNWVPTGEGNSLYIRPIYFATDEAIGVKPSENYRLVIFTSPAGPYFNKPIDVIVERNYSRSAEGGTGFAKAAGNYGGAMYPTKLAQQKGFDAVLWTDAIENKWLEEGGAMNLMFVFGESLVTPPLSNSKLAGVTRNTILTIAKDWGIDVIERNISIDDLLEQYKLGNVKEAFGCGTAANISHINSITVGEQKLALPAIETRNFSNKMLKYLNDYRMGALEDKFAWMQKV